MLKGIGVIFDNQTIPDGFCICKTMSNFAVVLHAYFSIIFESDNNNLKARLHPEYKNSH